MASCLRLLEGCYLNSNPLKSGTYRKKTKNTEANNRHNPFRLKKIHTICRQNGLVMPEGLRFNKILLHTYVLQHIAPKTINTMATTS